jgi:hypothetical protein
LLLTLPGLGCARKQSAPDHIGVESDADLKQRYGCIDVLAIEQSGVAYKALVFKLPKASESDSDYRVLFYKRMDGAYSRFGAESNLVNFERPAVVPGSPTSIETTERRVGMKFRYELSGENVELVPLGTDFQKIQRGRVQ